MQTRYFAALIVALVGVSACSEEQAPPTETWWINSFKVPCAGVAPMHCLQVHQGEAPFGEWQLLYQDIAGFEYAPGNLYRVKVRVIESPADQVPADASSLRYELVEVVEQLPDPRAPLHDIFVLGSIGEESVERAASGVAQSTIEFNIVQERYAGFDACRDFEGPILAVDGELLQLGRASASEEECPDGSSVTVLIDELASVAAWRRDGMLLELLDAQGTRRLLFRKVD